MKISELPKWEQDLLSQLPSGFDPRAARCEVDPTGIAAIKQPDMIKSLDEVRNYIDAIDFTFVKMKLQSPSEGGQGWPEKKVDFVEKQYKNWVFLRRKYIDQMMPPTVDIDQFWHGHILDTHIYHRDCAAIFGAYLHHYPYFGMGGKEDYQNLLDAFQNTLKGYHKEYGEELLDFEQGSPKPML